MSDRTVASLLAADALVGTELFYADDGVDDVKVTASQIRTFALAGLDSTLAAIGGLAPGADQAIYFTGPDVAATYTLTGFARSLLEDADAAAARGTLGFATTTTDNALVRFDGTAGQTQNSSFATLSDAGLLNVFAPGVDTYQILPVAGSVTLKNVSAGALQLGANNTSYLNLSSVGVFSPVANDQVPLGSGTLSWSDLFLASGGVINFNNGGLRLLHDSNTLDVITTGGHTLQIATNAGQVILKNINAGTLELGANNNLRVSVADTGTTFTNTGGGNAQITASDAAIAAINVAAAGASGQYGASGSSVVLKAISNHDLVFGSNNTPRASIPKEGGFVVGTAALATNATDGFLYIPTCAGTPTGTPTARTGTVAMIFDTTNNKLYIYDGGWLGGTAPGAWS